ncbi:DIRC2 [Bugula neritina]|uniref:DIRC2 n=1 Tax=Bugula neritina TaxID=10212 RepID=A0A7J7KED4_BUGNE|nr:DIRC2 [Bugula neritina]
MKHLLSNGHFWKLTLAFNLPNGIFNSWIPFCSVSFRSLGVDEVTSGWIGFSALLISSLLSIPISWIADRFKRKLKLFLQLANGLALALYLILALIQRGCISISDHQLSIAVLYILSIGAATCINGFIPIYYELASECAFPVDESLACALLSTLNNVFGVVFFLLLLIPALASDSEWMVWTCVGACALAVPLLFFMKENYYRLDVDTACTQTDEEYRAVAS